MEQNILEFTPEFIKSLQEGYLKNKQGHSEWDDEWPELEKIIPLIHEEISTRYSIVQKCLGVGGTCVILKCHDNNLGIPCALKFPRPNPIKAIDFSEIVKEEISHLLETRHPNIIQIYFQGCIRYNGRKIHFYLMEFIDEVTDALDYFQKTKRSLKDIINVLEQVVEGISHLHNNNIVHLDIKLENVLISSSSGRTVISDLGSARKLSENDENVKFNFTEPFAHPELIAKKISSTSTDPNRFRANLRRIELKKAYDLYALGKNLWRLLKFHDVTKWKSLDFYHRKYLELMAVRLLDAKNQEKETALGLPKSAFDEIKYNSIDEVAIDLKKVTGEYPLHIYVPEMNKNGIKMLQVSGLSTTVFTPRLNSIIENQAFRRLGDVTQLGFINLIFPTATHSRMEHVIGTFSNVACYCDALYNDPVNPLFKQIIKEDDLNAVLLAGLLHDLGQYPLAHDFEEAEPNIFSHKKITEEMLNETQLAFDLKSLRQIITDDWKTSPKRIVDIISADPKKLDLPIKDRLLHTIIDSPIDADKLDYLIRDSNNLNVPYGKAIDFQRLFRLLTVIFREQENKVYIALGIHEKGKIPAEAVAFARYAMFGAVYWHHTSRSMKSMLHRAIWEALAQSKLPEQTGIKGIKSDFRKFIFSEKRDKQVELFQSPKESQFKPSQISSSDLRIIYWIGTHSTGTGNALLEMLTNRLIYKRILVISQKNHSLWDELISLRKNYGWEGMIDLEKKFQSLILEDIRQFDPKKRTLSVLEVSATDKIIELDEMGHALFLIDIPIDRPAGEIRLEYLPESDRRELLEEWKRPCTLEHSIMWKQFEKSFISSVGKIRVFCHPKIDTTILAAFDRSKLEKILEDSIRAVVK